MAMSLGSGRGFGAEINVTPMIDVLLVLLIIFMTIAPTMPTGLEALVPQTAASDQQPPRNDLVITVLGDEKVKLNEQEVVLAELGERLKGWLKSAPNHAIFVKGKGDLD